MTDVGHFETLVVSVHANHVMVRPYALAHWQSIRCWTWTWSGLRAGRHWPVARLPMRVDKRVNYDKHRRQVRLHHGRSGAALLPCRRHTDVATGKATIKQTSDERHDICPSELRRGQPHWM